MKVLQINANYGFGSTGLIVKDIGDTLRKNGDESYFAYQRTNEIIQNGYQVGNNLDWKFHALWSRILGRQGYYSTIATKKLLTYINSICPDVVHLHNLHSNFINIDILFSFLARENIPTVITMHDCWYFTGKCFHYIDCGCDGFQYGCGHCKKKDAPPKSYLFDWSAWSLKNKKKRLSAIPRLKIIGCSDWICREAQKSFLNGFDICRVYNGVDVDVFKPLDNDLRDKYKVNNSYLVMGMANKWMQNDNIDLIEQVLALGDLKLMIVGCTNEQITFLGKYGEDVIPVGFIKDRSELAKHYSSADVFINLTHADTLPTVNMESICCGTPVITYDSCGSPELIEENTGLVVKESDKIGIINAIDYARNNKWSKCREVGTSRFDKRICYENYLDIYSLVAK